MIAKDPGASVADYWYRNPLRWKRCLVRAANLADMYELRRPDAGSIRGNPSGIALEEFRNGMFWKTTHRRFERASLLEEGDDCDPMNTEDPEMDAPTCFACICGLLRELDGVTSADIRFVLGVSASRQADGWHRWRKYTEDFRRMVRCLSGDLAKDAMRHLVLGELRHAQQDAS
jgi:hypothetical protein